MPVRPCSLRRRKVEYRRANRAGFAGLCAGVLLATGALWAPFVAAQNGKPGSAKQAPPKTELSKAFRGRLPITELTEDEATLHALDRLAYGPRPGDVERVKQMGLEKWIDQQLHPERIDDSALDARLQQYPAIRMSTEELLARYPRPNQQAQQQGQTRQQFQQQQRQQRQQQGQGQGDAQDMKNRPQEIVLELSQAKMTRAIYSERQLQEVMADFWFNHFNVFAGKGPERWFLPSYEREVIRPHTLGKFHDLLYATAKSPAMLFYLDNWLSVDPKAFEQHAAELQARRQRFLRMFGGDPNAVMMRQNPNNPAAGQGNQNAPQRRGLNENYGRELMELHTLGVDGGYTQQDVTQAALALTGWTMTAPRRNPEFHFDERFHGGEPKLILGQSIQAGGMRDGEKLLDMLVAHPSTAKFISTKLARRFVADNPPPELVARMAETFEKTNGDIREVLKTMIYSPEFWSRAAYRSKIKKPSELVVSALRAIGADMAEAMPAVRWSAQIGEPLYGCQPPTGYKDTADAWVNSGALLNRMNFSILLATGRMRDTKVDTAGLLGSADAKEPNGVLDRAVAVFLGGQVSKQTRAVLEKQLDDPQVLQAMFDDPVKNVDAGMIAGLVLGSPEFQRR
ncbi:MAG TPA: DUF1800 domain-containing protein [Candidatus Acidoferrales bacterium]|nr:DUF1800 domain-containing protein [Candidatus Acidoferrales bacterium]